MYLQGEVREAIDKHEDCAVQLDSYTDQLNGLKTGKENLEAEMEVVRRDNDELRQSLSDTQGQLDTVQAEKAELVARLTDLTEEAIQRNNLLQQAQTELEQLENKNYNLVEMVNEAERNYQEVVREKEMMQNQMEEENQEKEDIDDNREADTNNDATGDGDGETEDFAEEREDADEAENVNVDEPEQDLIENVDFEAEEEKREESVEPEEDDVGNLAPPVTGQDFIENSDGISTEDDFQAEEEKIKEEYEDQTEVSGFNMVYEISSSSTFDAGVDYTQQS